MPSSRTALHGPSLGPAGQQGQAGSGTLALAQAEGQLGHRDQDGAEDGPVALGQVLGVLSHHFQHHVPHFLGDITADIQQGGDVLIAGREGGVSPGTAPVLQTPPPRSREAKPRPGENWYFVPGKVAFSGKQPPQTF